jgi:hypothetical protein
MPNKRFTIAFVRAKAVVLTLPKLLYGIPHEIRAITVPRAKTRKERLPGMLEDC